MKRVWGVTHPWAFALPVPLGLAAYAALESGDIETAKILACAAALSPLIGVGKVTKEAEPELLPEGADGYRIATAAIRCSASKLEREHVLVGEMLDGTPVLAHKSHYPMHTVIVGGPGSQKTSTALVPQVTQNLAMRDCNAWVTFMRHDPAAIAQLLGFAREHGIRVKILTTVRDFASFLWNPFLDPAALAATPGELAEVLLAAMGINKGEAYGAGFFTTQNARGGRQFYVLLLPSFRHYAAAARDKALQKKIGIPPRLVELASHTVAIWEQLSDIRVMNNVPGDRVPESLFRHAIKTDDVIGPRPTLIISLLPTLISPTTPAIIARLQLALVALRMNQWRGPRAERVIMAFDDASPLIESSIKPIIENSRDMGLGLMVATHSITDFKNADIDLIPTVEQSVANKLFLTIQDRVSQDFLMRASGETTRLLRGSGTSVTEGPTGRGESEQEQQREIVVSRLTLEDFYAVNNDPELAIAYITPPRGFARLRGPAVVRLRRTVSAEEFARFRRTPWPEPDAVRTIRGDDIPMPAPIPMTPKPQKEEPTPPPAPEPQTPPLAGKRKKKTKAPDPEQQQRAESAHDRWRKFARDNEQP